MIETRRVRAKSGCRLCLSVATDKPEIGPRAPTINNICTNKFTIIFNSIKL